MLRALANWWDAVELWVTQLQFPIQVVLAVLVVLPLCWVTAAALDRAVDVTVRWAASKHRPDRGC
ncbi:MAG: hypothetical protein ACRDRH_05970 [Pseudonocardia sp.]